MPPIDLEGVQHTLGHLACPACERRRAVILCGGDIARQHTFQQASELWLETRELPGNLDRARYVKPRTIHDERQYLRALNAFFFALPLEQINIGHLRSYQVERSERAGPVKINQELALLKRILRRAGIWTAELETGYTRLKPKPKHDELSRAMSPEEQRRFLEVAASRSRWELFYWYSLVALQTTCNSCEMRGLHMGDVNVYERVLRVRAEHAKNVYRERTIHLTDQSLWALDRIYQRARGLGAIAPEHYIFPFRLSKKSWDVRRPMTEWGMTRPLHEVREAAGLPRLRIHDLRHTAITRMAEAGVPIPTIMSMAGHMTRQMMQHYTQISESAKRQAVIAAFEPALAPLRPREVAKAARA